MTAKLWHTFPDARQELLLKTCLFQGDAALASWRAWRDVTSIDELDIASQRLLPLAYRNLSDCGVKSAELDRYRGVARYVWYQNQSRVAAVEALLSIFSAAGIPAMALKGAALAHLYYRDVSLRPMNDIDILVPVRLAEKAGGELTRHGWSPIIPTPLGSPLFRSTTHAAAYRMDGYQELDLHWHAIWELCAEDADDSFWENAQELRIGRVAALALGDTDQLFHAIIHATRRDAVATIRWVADAAMILRRAEIDWHRLVEHATDGHLVRRMRSALRYLADEFRLPIPEHVLGQLESSHPVPIENLEARIDGSAMPKMLRQAGRRYLHYRRNRTSRSAPQFFPTYLRTTWGCETWSETLRAGFTRLPAYLGSAAEAQTSARPR